MPCFCNSRSCPECGPGIDPPRDDWRDARLRELRNENAALRQRCEQAEADARRYRWIRDLRTIRDEIAIGAIKDKGVCMRQGPALDAAIDAAIAHDAQEKT